MGARLTTERTAGRTVAKPLKPPLVAIKRCSCGVSVLPPRCCAGVPSGVRLFTCVRMIAALTFGCGMHAVCEATNEHQAVVVGCRQLVGAAITPLGAAACKAALVGRRRQPGGVCKGYAQAGKRLPPPCSPWHSPLHVLQLIPAAMGVEC